MKYELNRSYNGGGVVYLLKVTHLDHRHSRCLPGNGVDVNMWKCRWRDRLEGWDRLDEGSARSFLTLGQVNPSVSLFESTTNYWSCYDIHYPIRKILIEFSATCVSIIPLVARKVLFS